jgi:hypothetical protein
MIDSRVKGVVAIALPFFYWHWWIVNIRDWWTVDWVPRSTVGWKKTLVVRCIQAGIGALIRVRRLLMRAMKRRPNRAERALARVAAQGTEILIMFRSGSHELRDQIAEGRLPRLRSIPRVELLRIPGNDIRFRPIELQHYVRTASDAALTRVLASQKAESLNAKQKAAIEGHCARV